MHQQCKRETQIKIGDINLEQCHEEDIFFGKSDVALLYFLLRHTKPPPFQNTPSLPKNSWENMEEPTIDTIELGMAFTDLSRSQLDAILATSDLDERIR